MIEQRPGDRLHRALDERGGDEHEVARQPVGPDAGGDGDRRRGRLPGGDHEAERRRPSSVISSTANASATVVTPSPSAEIVVLEKTSLKLRSASAPSLPCSFTPSAKRARRRSPPARRVGVDRRQPRLRALRRLVGEAARAVLADVEHVAVAVEDVVDDLEEQAELGGELAPRLLLGARHLGRRERAADRRREERAGLQPVQLVRVAPSPRTSSHWPPIIASVAVDELARDRARADTRARAGTPRRAARRRREPPSPRRTAPTPTARRGARVVVERRQVVVDERERVHELDRGGGGQQALDARADRIAGGEAEHRPHPLAAERMAHRLGERPELGRQRSSSR